MDRDKVLELAGMAGFNWPEISTTTIEERLDRFAALVESEVRGGAEPVAWMYTLEYGDSVADKKISLNQLNYPFGVCGADYLRENSDGISYVRQTPLYAQPVFIPNQRPVAWIDSRHLDTISDFDTTVYAKGGFDFAQPLYAHPAPAASAESVASVHIKDGCLIGSQRKSGVDIPDGQYSLYPIGACHNHDVDVEQDRIDAECFRFWVREAAVNPSGMAKLISRCVTEQEYRDAIIPCVEKAKAAIAAAKKA